MNRKNKVPKKYSKQISVGQKKFDSKKILAKTFSGQKNLWSKRIGLRKFRSKKCGPKN